MDAKRAVVPALVAVLGLVGASCGDDPAEEVGQQLADDFEQGLAEEGITIPDDGESVVPDGEDESQTATPADLDFQGAPTSVTVIADPNTVSAAMDSADVQLLETREITSPIPSPFGGVEDVEAQGRFVGIRYELTNTSTAEGQPWAAFNSVVTATDGSAEWESHGDADGAVAVNNGDEQPQELLGPGFTTTTWVVFDVPAGAELAGLIYKSPDGPVPLALP